MTQRYPIARRWRIAAGVIGVLGIAAVINRYRRLGSLDWFDTIVGIAMSALFLWAAIAGRSPAWLEPGRHPDERQ